MSSLIRGFAQLPHPGDFQAPVVTMFSGGLDSAYLLLRLHELGHRNVHALAVDLGDKEDRATRRGIAEALGAVFHVVDGRQDFLDKFIRPAIWARATYLDTHPVSSSLSRPLIAAYAVDLAMQLGADLILHTANRSQNTLRRLNGALHDLGYDCDYGSPYDLDPISRVAKLRHLQSAGISILASRQVSGDSNLWCREYESGYLDDPECHSIDRVPFEWATGGHPQPLSIELELQHGLPVAVDGEPMPLEEVISQLNRRVGAHGHGRYAGLEHLPGGEKVLEVREMPAAWLIFKTVRQLEGACLPAEVIREKMNIEQLWVREALEGRWYQPLRAAAQGFLQSTADRVSGTVRWQLNCTGAITESIQSRSGIYLRHRETWEMESIAAERAAFQVQIPRPAPAEPASNTA